MTYHKRPLVKRRCAHCDTKFEAAHKSRKYCCQSCNTLAWRARQPPASAKSSAAPEPGSGSLALTAQNVGVVALGTLAAQGTVAVLQQLVQGGSPQEQVLAELRQLRQDLGLPPPASLPPGVELPSTFLPPVLAAATRPLVSLQIGEGPPQAYVRLRYHGHLLYHHPGQQRLFWAYAPGRYRRIIAATGLAYLAAHPPQYPGLPAPADSPPAATLAAVESPRAAADPDEAQVAAATAAFAQALAELAADQAAQMRSPLAEPPAAAS